MSSIEFWFDFGSPYSYIASEWIVPLAARSGRTIDWQPMLLGPAFAATGQTMLIDIPLKGAYSRHDFDRSARFHGLPYVHPARFPVGTVAAARALLWLRDADAGRTDAFVQAVFRAYFAQGRDISDAAIVAAIAAEVGIDATALAEAIRQPELKEALKRQVDAAIARGIFGAPFIVIDGEPFWGNDRQPQIMRWLDEGPF